MTTPGTPAPQGALIDPPELPGEGTRLWWVGRWSGRRWLACFVVRKECNELSHSPRMFGAFVERLEESGGGTMRSGPNTFSWLDLNVRPNTYNDHYCFIDEADARRYYEEP